MSVTDELEQFSEYIDRVADELSGLLTKHFEEVFGQDPEDENLFHKLIMSGILDDLARMPIDGVVQRTARVLRADGRNISNEQLALAVANERSRMVSYMRAEARAGFEQARARILQGVALGGRVERDVLEQASKVFVDYMHSKVSVAVMVWQRIVIEVAARDIFKGKKWLWRYAGVRDNRNRKFCASVLDMQRDFDDSQVTELNQHPDLHPYVPPNVRTLCGGYGCRHVFLPVSMTEAGDRYKEGSLWQA